MIPTKQQIDEAYKSYLDGNRAPWVESRLAEAYCSALALVERQEKVLSTPCESCGFVREEKI